MNTPTLTPRRMLIMGVSALVFVVSLICLPLLVENLDAGDVMVIQSVTGDLNVYTEPGPKWQGFGKVTVYPRRDQYSFSAAKDQGKTLDQSIATGFNDGGVGHVSGVVSWEMPLKPDAIIRLHKEYGSLHAIDQQLIRPMLEKVIFSAGATMSSIESSSERKPEIPQSIDDQLQHGPYLTKVSLQTQKDGLTGQEKTVRIVQIATDKDGKPIRASASTIKEYGISLSPVTVNALTYSAEVTQQIAERQKSTQRVALSIASAAAATQDAITTEQTGKANAAKAKWDQETVNAKEIALAEKDVAVATQKAKAAEQFKKEQTLMGEGEAARKRLVMEANGALDVKLEAYVAVSKAYASAIENAQPGAWSPSVVMGGASSTGGAGAQALVEMLTAKTARELGLDMNVTKGNTTKK